MTMSDIRKAVPLWFSTDTLRFFNSKVYDDTFVLGKDGKGYFVTSEKAPFSWATRRYTVRVYDPVEKRIEKYGEYEQFGSKKAAAAALRRALAEFDRGMGK